MNDTSPLSTSPLPLRESRNSHGYTTSSKRSSRIEKPRSIHSSPTSLERRKTTSAAKRYVTLEDRWNMMFGSGDEEMQDSAETSAVPPSTRPVSWHPTSSNYFNSFDSSPANDLSSQNGGYGFPDQTSAYPSPASGYASNSALAYLSALAQRKRDTFPLATLDNDTSMDTSPFPAYHESTASFPAMASAGAQQSWTPAEAPTSHPRTQAGSSECLPIQGPDEDADSLEEQSPKESANVLVGMGLYDPPSYESMLTSGLGKGLKLEETWQPPPDIENEDEDDSSDEESIEEAPEPPKQADEADDTQRWTPARAVPAADLSGQSFLLEDEDTYTNEWWYQQLKRPTAQDAGLGYGWLQPQC
ncbi:hypothetical protein SLS56_005764 [Neofusicoccum ribis]|uniref:Uncharacterized protein n=1 Tax=Neofusicoccum ribis TaxID=45134 RepID=A0ABR3STP2_9PEZI